VRLLVDVDLRDLERTGTLGRDLLDHGAEHPARSAPRCPVVDEHRDIGVPDLAVEGGVG